jgi:hypothetical protein
MRSHPEGTECCLHHRSPVAWKPGCRPRRLGHPAWARVRLMVPTSSTGSTSNRRASRPLRTARPVLRVRVDLKLGRDRQQPDYGAPARSGSETGEALVTPTPPTPGPAQLPRVVPPLADCPRTARGCQSVLTPQTNNTEPKEAFRVATASKVARSAGTLPTAVWSQPRRQVIRGARYRCPPRSHSSPTSSGQQRGAMAGQRQERDRR